jgi:hypothetical protein
MKTLNDYKIVKKLPDLKFLKNRELKYYDVWGQFSTMALLRENNIDLFSFHIYGEKAKEQAIRHFERIIAEEIEEGELVAVLENGEVVISNENLTTNQL